MIDNSHNGFDGKDYPASNAFGFLVRIIGGLILLLAVGLVISTCTSCTTQKAITKQTASVDSSVVKEKQDSIRLLSVENQRLEQQVKELQYGVVKFDTVFMPGDTVVNTVTITKEGEVKASGKITSAYVSKSVLTNIVSEKQRLIDSLSAVKQKEVVKVVTKTEYVDKKIKRKWFSGFGFWLLFAVVGFYMGWKARAFMKDVDKI